MLSGSEAAATHADMWVIEPRQHGAFSRLRELWSYRYLWWYFASETIVSLYRGSMLGWVWLLLRVVAPVGLNALVFGDIFDLKSQVEHVPYFVFFLSGTITWTIFERSLVYVTRSLERNRKLVTRVYFPDAAANAEDPVLALVPPERRATLIAKKKGEGVLEWNVVLQGSGETVFFDF